MVVQLSLFFLRRFSAILRRGCGAKRPFFLRLARFDFAVMERGVALSLHYFCLALGGEVLFL